MEKAPSPWTVSAPAIRGFAAALALTALSTAAAAQTLSMPVASFGITKTQAILGGGSALDRILAQQGAAPALQPPAPTGFAVSFGAARSVSPAFPAIARVPISPHRPDVFNSVALEIDRSPLAARWSRAGHGAPDAPATRFAASLLARDTMRRIEAVNLYVNRRVRFVDDTVQYRAADHWAPAAQTLARGKGDCEDFAIAKIAMLRRAGFAERDLYLVIAKDLVRRQDHAVAVVRAEGRLWVLDNGTDVLVDSVQARDYRPVLTFSAGRSWTHGYRRATPPMVMAKASEPAPVAVTTLRTVLSNATLAPASDQRSRSASLFAFNTGLSK